jgi:hypothetical protein
MKGGFPRRHAMDLMHFGKSRSPVCLPVGPGGMTLPFAPHQGHVPGGEGVFVPGGDHGGVGDGDASMVCQYLAFFLLPGVRCQWQDWVDAGVELHEVILQVRLADLGICHQDVHDKHTQIDAIEALDWIIQYGLVDVIDGGGKLAAGDREDQVIGRSHLASSSIGGL